MTTATVESEPLVLRRAQVGDGLAIWRLARHRPTASQGSPWFFMTLTRHVDGCWVAEDDSGVVGYIVAAQRDGGRTVHVFDMALSPLLAPEEQYLVLGQLLREPGFEEARELTFARTSPISENALRSLALTPLAESRREAKPASDRRSGARIAHSASRAALWYQEEALKRA